MDKIVVTPQKSDASEKSKRFNVIQVQGSTEGAKDTARGEGTVSETAPRSPGTDENTVGYGTNEAVPMTVFYRNESSRREKDRRRSRPTLYQLRKGFETEGNGLNRQVSNYKCRSLDF